MIEIRFYFDESVELAVSQQLSAAGIDAVSVHSLDQLGDTDPNHLNRATQMGRALCTYDQDFLRLAATGSTDSGIIFAQQQHTSIGIWVQGVKLIHARFTAQDLLNQVIFLPNK